MLLRKPGVLGLMLLAFSWNGAVAWSAPPPSLASCIVPIFQQLLKRAAATTQPETQLRFLRGMKLIVDKVSRSNPKGALELKAVLGKIQAGTLDPSAPEVTQALAKTIMSPEAQRAIQLSLRNPQVQDAFYALFNDLNSSGQLRVFLNEAAQALKADPNFVKSLRPTSQAALGTPGALEAAVEQVSGMLDVTLKLHSQDPHYWANLAKAASAKSRRALAPFQDKIATDSRLFESAAFQQMLEKELDTRFLESKLTRYADGPGARAIRTELLKDAEEIEMLTWAFYDDATGLAIADELVAAGERGAKVRVLVDAQTSAKPGHQEAIKRLSGKKNIEVIAWSSGDPQFPYYGNHRKALVVTRKGADGAKETRVLLGGRNPGDLYYTTWDDSEVLIEGPAALGVRRQIAELWNTRPGAGVTALDPAVLPPSATGSKSATKSATIMHNPGPNSPNPIYMAHRLALDSMRKGDEVLLENAYLIADPAFYRSLLRARKRGVKVTLLSNSPQSVDEPIVANPIARTMSHMVTARLKDLEKAGVNVKRGEDLTDHTKVSVFLKKDKDATATGMVIDMSHNVHPRSLRLEGEIATISVGKEAAEDAARMIRSRIDSKTAVTAPIETSGNALEEEIITRLGFYNLL